MFFQLILQTQDPVVFGGSLDENAVLAGVFRLLFLVITFFYMLFAIIIIRQVQIMKNTLITTFSPGLLLLSFLHFILAVGVFILFIVIT